MLYITRSKLNNTHIYIHIHISRQPGLISPARAWYRSAEWRTFPINPIKLSAKGSPPNLSHRSPSLLLNIIRMYKSWLYLWMYKSCQAVKLSSCQQREARPIFPFLAAEYHNNVRRRKSWTDHKSWLYFLLSSSWWIILISNITFSQSCPFWVLFAGLWFSVNPRTWSRCGLSALCFSYASQ